MTKTASQRNRNNRERGKAFEKKIADMLGWIRVPYSGSAEVFGFGDVRDHEDQQQTRYMGECKSITPRSTKEVNYIIQEKWLVGQDSIVSRAKKQGNKMPLLFFTKARSSLSFVTMRDKDFKMMHDALEVLRQRGLIDGATDVDDIRAQINSLLSDKEV